MRIPNNLNAPEADATAACLVRSLEGRSESWGVLLATAQAAIGFAQDLELEQLLALQDQSAAVDLLCAARTLDAGARFEEFSQEERDFLSLNAAAAFGMTGNFVTAAAALSKVSNSTILEYKHLPLVLSCVSPLHLSRMLSLDNIEDRISNAIESWAAHLVSGNPSESEVIDAFFDAASTASTSLELSLLLSAKQCLHQASSLSTHRVFKSIEHQIPEDYLTSLCSSHTPILLPPQKDAILNSSLLKNKDNCAFVMPTSTGKTLLGEIALIDALGYSPGLVCYIVPYVALGRQVSDRLRLRLPERYRIHTLVGGFKRPEPLNPEDYQEIVVATPERFDALLRNSPQHISHIRCVVIDEAHLIESNERGLKLESIITRLKLIQRRLDSLRIVLLSAVVDNLNILERWCASKNIFASKWVPTARRIALWSEDGKLRYHFGPDIAKVRGTNSTDVLGIRRIPWPNQNLYASDAPGIVTKLTPNVHANIAYLTEILSEQSKGAILAVCNSKRSSRALARACAARLSRIEPLPQRIAAIISLIEQRYGHLQHLIALVARGVSYHNASLPHPLRTMIEDAVKERQLKIVCSTTTLAEGVDLPFRYTVLADWMQWSNLHMSPMSPLLFRNIAGRCGRAGSFTEGDIIIFDNPLGSLEFTNKNQRRQFQLKNYVSGQQANLRTAAQRFTFGESTFPLDALISGQIIAAINENPEDENLIQSFLNNAPSATEASTQERLRTALSISEQDVLSGGELALATKNSPLKLTEFGISCNKTGFSPASCRAIVEVLRDWDGKADEELSRFLSDSLTLLWSSSEAKSPAMDKIYSGARNRFSVKAVDLPNVLNGWFDGKGLEYLFSVLPSAVKSSRSPKVNKWLQGLEEPSTWDEEFDKFSDFFASTVTNYLPWYLRACGHLSRYASERYESIDWEQLADFTENGVDTLWSLNALRYNSFLRRSAIVVFGRLLGPIEVTPWDPLGLEWMKNQNYRWDYHFDSLRRSVAEESDFTISDIEQIEAWLLPLANL